MGFRIPTPLQSTAKDLGLNSWVNKRDFPRDSYFNAIEALRASALALSVQIDEHKIAALLAAMLDEEDALTTHVLALRSAVDISSSAVWEKCCMAAAYVTVQRYVREVENGKWPG